MCTRHPLVVGSEARSSYGSIHTTYIGCKRAPVGDIELLYYILDNATSLRPVVHSEPEWQNKPL